MLCDRGLEFNGEIHCFFRADTKAFDRVQQNILFELLSDQDFSKNDLRLIENVYFNQQTVIKLDNEFSDPVPICRGVRQGCVLSPHLFSYYSEVILCLGNGIPGIVVGGHHLTNIRYADETVLRASTENELQELLNEVNDRCKKTDMLINPEKTEFMVISRSPDTMPANVRLDEVPVKILRSFIYLESTRTNDGRSHKEICNRINMAKNVFFEMKTLLCNLKLDLGLSFQLWRC